MIYDLVSKLGIKLEMVEDDYIQTEEGRKARGAFRWDYENRRGEIRLARSATEQTWRHEIGHAINFILGKGEKYSDKIGMGSEDFANMVSEILRMCYSKNAEEEPND